MVHWYLDRPPVPKPTANLNCCLIIDGTWFKKQNCLLVYFDHHLKKVQWWRYTTSEKAEQIQPDLLALKKQGVIAKSLVSDGGTGISRAIRLVYPNQPHQRCLVHLQRLALSWITRRPKTEAGKQIKPIVQKLYQVNSPQAKKDWVGEYQNWSTKWEKFLKEKTYHENKVNWWYTHKSLRRVRSLITNALPDIFHYLDWPGIPKSTNGLEGRLSSFKQHYRQHRGLSKTRREGYISWYLMVVVNKEIPTF